MKDSDLTPVENRGGMWYKREDLFSGPFGVNGAKYRACRHLAARAVLEGYERVVSAASVLSPQSAMAAVVARDFGMESTVIVGGTTPEKAVRHRSIEIATAAGATIESIKVGYNPALQGAGRRRAEELGAWQLPYGITTRNDAHRDEVHDFVRVGAPQTQNLPDEVETLLLPFGSGNTGAGVLYGLHDHRPASLKKVVLFTIGPDRLGWVKDRLGWFGRDMTPPGVDLEIVPLHPTWATYGDKMPETEDGIVFHPTYEGKIVRYMKTLESPWWNQRDGKTAFWIVGGPLP